MEPVKVVRHDPDNSVLPASQGASFGSAIRNFAPVVARRTCTGILKTSPTDHSFNAGTEMGEAHRQIGASVPAYKHCATDICQSCVTSKAAGAREHGSRWDAAYGDSPNGNVSPRCRRDPLLSKLDSRPPIWTACRRSRRGASAGVGHQKPLKQAFWGSQRLNEGVLRRAA